MLSVRWVDPALNPLWLPSSCHQRSESSFFALWLWHVYTIHWAPWIHIHQQCFHGNQCCSVHQVLQPINNILCAFCNTSIITKLHVNSRHLYLVIVGAMFDIWSQDVGTSVQFVLERGRRVCAICLCNLYLSVGEEFAGHLVKYLTHCSDIIMCS